MATSDNGRSSEKYLTPCSTCCSSSRLNDCSNSNDLLYWWFTSAIFGTLAECSLDDLWRGELDLELIQLEHLRQHQHEIHKQLKALARADERVQLLQTIPGVGRKTVEVVVAYLDVPHRFQNARQVSSYAGMVPRRYQSGEMDRQGRIHKRGPRQLRSALLRRHRFS